MGIHTIRLRAPWRLERQEHWLLWRRAFGRPTNLSNQQFVRLVVQSETAEAIVMLNDRTLGPAPAAYDVTSALEARNLLVLSIASGEASDEAGGAPPFDVRLEIGSRLSQDDPVAE